MDPRVKLTRRVDGGTELRIKAEDLAAMGPLGLASELLDRLYRASDLGKPVHRTSTDTWVIPVLRGPE